jgi:hypothetical protein
MLIVVMLNVVMLSVIELNFIMLSAVAPNNIPEWHSTQDFGYLMINLAVSEVNTEPILHLIRITNYQAYNFFIYSLSFW